MTAELKYFAENPREEVYNSMITEWGLDWANRGLDDFKTDPIVYDYTFTEALEFLKGSPFWKESRMEDGVKDPVKEVGHVTYRVTDFDKILVQAMIIALDDSCICYTYSTKEVDGTQFNGHLTLPFRMHPRDLNSLTMISRMESVANDSRLPALYERHMQEVAVRIGTAQKEELTEHVVPEQVVTEKAASDGVSRIFWNDLATAAFAIAMRDGRI